MKLKKLLSMLLVTIVLFPITVTPAFASTYTGKLDELAELIKEYGLYSSNDGDPIAEAIERYFTENPDKFSEFVNYIFENHDGYSHYYSAEDYSELYPAASEYVGIGVEMDDSRTDGHFIKNVFRGSPAEAAGILSGDEIIAVDGEDVRFLPMSSLTSKIRGEEGSDVTIAIRRDNLPSVTEYTIVRRAIQVSNIELHNMGDGVAYIKILRFGDFKTFLDFANMYTVLPDMGFTSVIFDVRNNPGGSLDVLLNILNYIVPEEGKELISIYSRDSGHDVYLSDGLGWMPDKMIVLVNEHTASAAEVLAGTLKVLGYAEVVGTPTYGKGLGQYHFTLDDGSVAILTSFEIKLSGSVSYNGEGINPDYTVYQQQAPYPMPKLGELSHRNSVFLGEESDRVRELELRLNVLGYLRDTPDNIFDESTLYAVQSFARDNNLRILGYASGNMIYHLNRAIEELAATQIVVDTQLETAIDMAKAISQ